MSPSNPPRAACSFRVGTHMMVVEGATGKVLG